MNAEAERLLQEAMSMTHQAIMALEHFREGAHVALVADEIAASETKEAIGQVYVGHMHCCWGQELDAVARSRRRELDRSKPLIAETPC